jgi:hypothetical protein
MISVSGTVIGDLATVVFTPSRQRFTDSTGDVVVGEPVYALTQNISPGVSQVSVDLPDNSEMLSTKDWVWMVYETSILGGKVLFTLPSDQADYQYADIRPVGGP